MRTLPLLGFLAALVGRTSHPSTIVIMEPDEGDVLWFGNQEPDALGSGGELRIFVDPETYPEARASFAKYTMGIGHELPIHRHLKTEEFAYIISGDGVAVALDDDGSEHEIPIAAGYVWYNPPGVWHAVRNKGSVPLEMVFTTVPNEKKGLLSYFRKIAAEPGKPGIAISPEAMEQLGREHDLILRSAPEHED